MFTTTKPNKNDTLISYKKIKPLPQHKIDTYSNALTTRLSLFLTKKRPSFKNLRAMLYNPLEATCTIQPKRAIRKSVFKTAPFFQLLTGPRTEMLPHPSDILLEIIVQDSSLTAWLKNKPWSRTLVERHLNLHHADLTIHKRSIPLFIDSITYTNQTRLAKSMDVTWTRWARRQLLNFVFVDRDPLTEKSEDRKMTFTIHDARRTMHADRPHRYTQMDHLYRVCATYNVHPLAFRARMKELNALDEMPTHNKKQVVLTGVSEPLITRLDAEADRRQIKRSDLILDILGAATYASPVPENCD